MKIDNRGFSLVSVLVAAGLLGGLSVVMLEFSKQSSKSTVKYQFDTDINQITNEISAILSDPNRCLTTFTNATQGPLVNDVATTPTANRSPITSIAIKPSTTRKYQTIGAGGTVGYGNAKVKIKSYGLSAITANEATLTITFENRKILGTSDVTREIKLYVEGGTPITACRSLSKSSTDIWSRGAGTDIYYNLGNVGIGMATAPTAKLDITGNLKVSGTINAGGTITAASDKRLKKDVTSLDDSLDKILGLRGVEFSWINRRSEKGRQIGFIAQEVEEIYPELVYTDSKGMKSVAYQNLVAPLVEAIREQQTQIETLKQALCEMNPKLDVCSKK